MAMAAKSFGRRPREEAVVTKPAASLGAVLELMRALNWFIRADVPWPTQRDQAFDFVLAGESGVFAMWVHEGEPTGVEEATDELGRLLGGVNVRPVVCRAMSSLANADSRILFCTPETALDLLVGLPTYQDQTPIPTIVNRLRELVVPVPQPAPQPAPVVKPAPAPPPVPVATPAPVEKPAPVAKKPVAPEPPVLKPAPAPTPVLVEKSLGSVEPSVGSVEPSLGSAEPSVGSVEPSVVAPAEVATPKPERVSGGRHRSEKPRRARRTPPAPPAAPEKQKSTLELPTAIASTQPRRKGGNEAAQRFANNYVYVPPPVEKKASNLKREFKPGPFVFGIVGLLVLALAVGFGVKEWPKIKGLAGSNSNPSAAFGQPISVNSTNFHPSLTLTVTQPVQVSVGRGAVSYAVTLTAVNTGTGPWQLPDRSAISMSDSIGETNAVADIRGGRWAGTVNANGRWVGKLVFKLHSGRTPASFQMALASTSGETAIWK